MKHYGIYNKNGKLVGDYALITCPVCGHEHEPEERRYGVCPNCKVVIYDD